MCTKGNIDGELQVLVLGASISVVAFSLQAISLQFPLFVVAWGLNGIGLSLQDAQANAIVATLQRKPTLKMGLFQAVYGSFFIRLHGF